MKLSVLLEDVKSTQGSYDGGPYFPTRPMTAENTFLWLRIKAAWKVLTGKADAVEWDEENNAEKANSEFHKTMNKIIKSPNTALLKERGMVPSNHNAQMELVPVLVLFRSNGILHNVFELLPKQDGDDPGVDIPGKYTEGHARMLVELECRLFKQRRPDLEPITFFTKIQQVPPMWIVLHRKQIANRGPFENWV